MKESEYVAIVYTVPESHAEAVRNAIGDAGAGAIGAYSHCSFSVKGIGRFKPHEGANPFIGSVGALEEVVEERVETMCRRSELPGILLALHRAHPYEVPFVFVTALIH